MKRLIHKLANDRDKRLKVMSDSEPYLGNRDQFYLLNCLHPKPYNVPCVIPQGSCLGSLLLTLRLNSFDKCLCFSQAHVYADDAVPNRELLNVAEFIRVTVELFANIIICMKVFSTSFSTLSPQYNIIKYVHVLNITGNCAKSN